VPIQPVYSVNFIPRRVGYLRQVKKEKDYEQSFEIRIFDDLQKLKQLLEYTVGVIEFQTDSDSEATELFIRFNSTGKKLTKSDLFLAELAVKVQGLATDDILRVAQKWPKFGFTMPFLTQCLLAVCTGRLRTNAKDAWADYTPNQIKEAWRKTKFRWRLSWTNPGANFPRIFHDIQFKNRQSRGNKPLFLSLHE
jgi:hypothetical protein